MLLSTACTLSAVVSSQRPPLQVSSYLYYTASFLFVPLAHMLCGLTNSSRSCSCLSFSSAPLLAPLAPSASARSAPICAAFDTPISLIPLESAPLRACGLPRHPSVLALALRPKPPAMILSARFALKASCSCSAANYISSARVSSKAKRTFASAAVSSLDAPFSAASTMSDASCFICMVTFAWCSLAV
jgi:hypothetical protein